MAPSDEVAILARKAERIAIVGRLVETFDTAEERLALIKHLVDSHSISQFAGDLLAENYAMEPGL
jgi:RPA family protein